MTEHVQVGGLQVAKVLFDFVNNEAIPGTGLTADTFWAGADKVIHDLAPKNKALLAKRDDFQARIDAWHQACRPGPRRRGLQSLPARNRLSAARSGRFPGNDAKRR
jgi:hypothetical protein